METAEIRRRFLEHFEKRGHTVVPSASLVSPDPSLLFTVAGMVPFIPYLTGREPAPYPRATSVQKCVRTLDIEEVGKTTRHGTFFQMNGNFSFGDYFKAEAIQFAWELVTGRVEDGGLGLDPERIWPTVYLDDDEAFDAWRTYVPAERIQRRGKDDNYWSTGAPGPAGPCSEIHYDRGPEYGPGGGPEVDPTGDRYLEIWNLVFMQYERGPGEGKEFPILGELPKKNIDTGMGLERVAYLLQGVDNMYEIDQVAPVLHRAADLAGIRYGADHEADVRLRVVADHVRSGLMLIGDGVTPGNEGRGYILRRLLRRAVRSMKLLGVDEATLPELLPVSRDAMSPSYPELATDFARISGIAYAEEEAFRRTLTAGTALFDTAVTQAKAAGTPSLSGAQAFSLHDTYGFPIDVTLEMAAEQGVTVDEAGFRALMTEQRERARADARAKRTGSVDVLAYRRLLSEFGPTDWRAYDTLRTDSRVLGVVDEGDADAGEPVVGPGSITRVVLDRTPFYAESGGQVADAGELTWDGGRAEVVDVQRPVKGLVAHQVRVLQGELRAGTELTAQVDREWRLSACQAHSGTHVLHAALRQVLGPQALQSGSYNRPGYLRLDFAWQGALSAQQRIDVEDVANAAVRADHGVRALYMTLPEAREFGALALFGETYGEQVRVVEIGGEWSRELCGGTHVRGSAQIGTLALTGESSVGSGARRVEAAVGLEGFRYLARERDLVRQLADLLKTPQDGLVERVSGMLGRLRDADKELADLRAQQTLAAAGDLAGSARDLSGISVVTGSPAGLSGGDLRSLALDVRGRLGEAPAAVVLASAADGKVALIAAVNPAAQQRGLSANDLLRAAAPAVGGRGGGKPDVAQGGGTDPSGIPAALVAVEQAIGGSTA
jgi:alanyl-tRNA synthetase